MNKRTDPTPTPSDLRAKLARSRLYGYRVAAELHMHPGTLSSYLHERRPITPDLAERVADAIDRLSAAAEQRPPIRDESSAQP